EATLRQAADILRKVDRLPSTLRLTLTENPPSENVDPDTGMLTYTTDRNSQVVDTIEGALLTIDYAKFHQSANSDGWTFMVNDEPTAIRELSMRVKLAAPRTVEIVMTFTRYENQERRVFGRIVAGELGTWIALLPQPQTPATDANTNVYSTGPKAGSQLFLKVEKVLVPTRTPAR